uniref:hypothetical protein 13 n=1 Tax=Moniliophthora perniciosa TaxID=153609 RepID=UPI0000242347|nr:hypothetical protein 13 [Moniliophthora perniciosa]AAQ74303.1 hypothetical protein 13 [Moniliophthora perniciosa]
MILKKTQKKKTMILNFSLLINNDLLNFILINILMFLLWFYIGYYLYNNSLKFRNFANNTTWYKFLLITFLAHLFLGIILNLSIGLITNFFLVSNNIIGIENFFAGQDNLGSGGNSNPVDSNQNQSNN